MRSLLLCLTVLTGAAVLDARSTTQAASVSIRPDAALAAVMATDGALAEAVQYYREDRRAYRADRREWRRHEEMRRRAEARRRAEWRYRNGYR